MAEGSLNTRKNTGGAAGIASWRTQTPSTVFVCGHVGARQEILKEKGYSLGYVYAFEPFFPAIFWSE